MELKSAKIKDIADLREEKRRSLHLPVFPDFHAHLVGHSTPYALYEGRKRAGYVLLMVDSHEGHEHVTFIEMYLASPFREHYEDALDLVRTEREPKAYLARSDDCVFETALIVQGFPMETTMVVMTAPSPLPDVGSSDDPSVSLEPLDYPYLRQAHELYAHVKGEHVAPSPSDLEALLDDDRLWVLVRDGEVIGVLEVGPAAEKDFGTLEAVIPHAEDSDTVWAIREAGEKLARDGLVPLSVVDTRDERKIRLFREAGYITSTVYLVFYDPEAGRPSVPSIGRDELWSLLQGDSGVRLVDVLGEEHWRSVHLPGSEWIDFRSLTREARRRFSKDEPIVLYCSDYT